MAPIRNALIYVLAVAVLGTGAIAVYDRKALTSTPSQHSTQGSVLTPLPPPFPGVERLRIMLVGADERKGDVGRSDTLMVLQVNPTLRRAALLSIPRDTYAAIPGHGHNKINAAYAFGGPELSKQTVEQLLGITLDGYVKINIEGFVKAVDTLGGVDINVEDVEGKGRGMNYDCPGDGLVIHLFPGPQHLTGYKAMGYVRYRHSNIPGRGGTDFQREARQQKLLKALLVQKVRVTNIPALMKAGQQLFSCVDSTLSWRQIFDLMRFMKELQPGEMKSVPLEGADEMIRGVYYCKISDEKLRETTTAIEDFLSGTGMGDEEAGAPLRLEVLNGYTKPGAAAKAAEMLKAKGFDVVTVGNATTRNYLHTTVLYRGDMQTQAREVADLVNATVVEQDPSGPAAEGTAQVQVTLGKDYVSAAPSKNMPAGAKAKPAAKGKVGAAHPRAKVARAKAANQ